MSPVELKELRKELGLSIADAARQVQIHPRSWARYEAGDRQIPKGMLELFLIKNDRA